MGREVTQTRPIYDIPWRATGKRHQVVEQAIVACKPIPMGAAIDLAGKRQPARSLVNRNVPGESDAGSAVLDIPDLIEAVRVSGKNIGKMPAE